MSMTLDEAYRILGLIPLDDFIDQRVSRNRVSVRPLYQGIGATTWMLVSAALTMMSENVLLIDPSPPPLLPTSQGRPLLNRLATILKGLGYTPVWDKGMGNKCLKSVNNHRAFCNHGRRIFLGPVFHDNDWKEKAALKADLGPFGRIREIRVRSASWDEPDRDQYLAFGVDDTFLFELTWKGALKLLQADESIQTVGWKR